MADPHERLHTLLGADPPPGVLALSASAQSALADLVEDARRRQSASLQEAFAASLKHVPFPIRGIVRKVLLG